MYNDMLQYMVYCQLHKPFQGKKCIQRAPPLRYVQGSLLLGIPVPRRVVMHKARHETVMELGTPLGFPC